MQKRAKAQGRKGRSRCEAFLVYFTCLAHGGRDVENGILPRSEFVQSLSRRLFWDVDPETIDDRAHSRYVIQRVLERGSLEDIRATVAHYTLPFMISEAQQIRSLDPVTLAFAACLGNVKEETFRCCTSRQ